MVGNLFSVRDRSLIYLRLLKVNPSKPEMSDSCCSTTSPFIEDLDEKEEPELVIKPKSCLKKKVVVKEEPEPEEEEEEEEVEEVEEEDEDDDEDDEDDETYTEDELIQAAKEVGETGFKLGWVYGVRDYALGSGVVGLVLAGSIQLGLSVVKTFF